MNGTAKISGILQVGKSSLFLDPAQSPGQANSIYSNNGNLLIQSNSGNTFNTILNKEGGGVGIGPMTHGVLGILHIQGANAHYIFTTNSTSGYATIFHMDNTGLKFGPNSTVRDMQFQTNATTQMTIRADGKVIIGTGTISASGTYKLYVPDGILAGKVKSAVHGAADWSDDVFNADYDLWTLRKVEGFIDKYRHLNGVPSAEEVVKNGVDMVQMDAALLRKIEELFRYTIKQEKDIRELMLHVIEQQKEMKKMKKEIGRLKNVKL